MVSRFASRIEPASRKGRYPNFWMISIMVGHKEVESLLQLFVGSNVYIPLLGTEDDEIGIKKVGIVAVRRSERCTHNL